MSVKSSITHKVDIPHEPDQWIEFRELGWKVLESAREARSRTALLSFKDLGPAFFKSLTTTTVDEAPKTSEEAPVVTASADTYDMSILLRSSIIAWSYSEPCNESNIDELDPKTAEWAFKEILQIHFPTEDELGKVIVPLNSPSAVRPQ